MAKKYMIEGFRWKKGDLDESGRKSYTQFREYFSDIPSLEKGIIESEKEYEFSPHQNEVWSVTSYPTSQFSFYDKSEIIGYLEDRKFVEHDCVVGKESMKGLRIGSRVVFPIETYGGRMTTGVHVRKKCANGCSISRSTEKEGD